MAEASTFAELIRRVRAGDEQAAAELVEQYGPALRVIVRRRLTDRTMQRLVDSVDICQSVFANFFERIRGGEFSLDDPQQLAGLLFTMARNKLANYVACLRAARRDYRRISREVDPHGLADSTVGPFQRVEDQEMYELVRSRFTSEECWIADQLAAGWTWRKIAETLGKSADAVRVGFGRSTDRIFREFQTE